MDVSKENYFPNPRETANPFSILMFGYTFKLFKKGYSKTLDVDDLYNPLKNDRSKDLGDKLQIKWNYELSKRKLNDSKPSLFKAIVSTFWVNYLYLAVMVALNEIFKIVTPLLLGGLLSYFRPTPLVTKNDALMYAGLIVLANFGAMLIYNHYLFEGFHEGMRIRAACCALIYRKALRLSKTALGETASGKMVNLLSNDVSRFDLASVFLQQMWLSPASLIVIMSLLYKDAGYAGVTGVFAVVIIAILQGYTGKLSAIYRKQTAAKTDERIRLMDEILSAIQVIKMYAWEIPFQKIIRIARKAEIKIITKSSYIRATIMAFNLFTPRLALFCSILTVVLSGQEITASKIFVFTSYYNILSWTMGHMFVRGISEVAELMVAIKRIQSFLLNEEYDPNKTRTYINGNVKSVDDIKDIITLKNLTVKWNLSYSDNALENVNFNIVDGQLVGIIGPVGSGKSSLLQTLLGELEIVHGEMSVHGQVSYASQEPWVFAATIRQNILFGQEYDKRRYQKVIEVCALETDFKQFENGDLTYVGDRGASLSGGQKARINLARVVYREADIYLLDDPLSAVDIHVAKHIYDKCINGYLANRVRVLVTHQVHFLKNADHVIILKNGKIEDEGTFNILASSENMYAKLLTADPDAADTGKQNLIKAKYDKQLSYRSRTCSMGSMASLISELSVPDLLLPQEPDESNDQEDIQLKHFQEESSKGKVGGNLLFKYISAGSNVIGAVVIFLLFLMTQIAVSGVDYWVSYWVGIEELRNQTTFNEPQVLKNASQNLEGALETTIKNLETTTTTHSLGNVIQSLGNTTLGLKNVTDHLEPLKNHLVDLTTNNCLYIYGLLLFSLFVIIMARSFTYYKACMMSSIKLHSIIYESVTSTTMRFFDTNPGGRILNRFSKDIGSVDELLPKVIMDSTQILLSMLGSVILICVVNPYFLIVVAFLNVIFYFMRHVYLKSSKNIKRLEGMMRSPVFSHLRTSIEGLTTIRSFGAESILIEEFDKHQDYHSSSWYMFLATSSAFGFYLDAFCCLFLAALSFSFLTFNESLGMKGGQVGLAITQASALTFLLQWGMRQSAEVATQLMSVERVLEYKSLPKEIEPAVPKTPSAEWPQEGEIIFRDTCLRYFEGGPLVLKHLNLKINPKEKVGVVGRTGAGKSSLIQALFRLAPIEGVIEMDGIDTKNISLKNLRTKISIIPQDPVLFSGTLRYNLDPFDEYSDDVLYSAIQDVELKDPANIINRLENRVMDRGSNYSVGQRQLICLARAILKRNRILMLDEATANVDPQTDALIQKTIRKKFVDCSVITVAHRLNTIMDSDKVLVMDAGQVAEFDHPHLLLQNKNGVFYKMVQEAGKTTCDQLKKIASESYQKPLIPE